MRGKKIHTDESKLKIGRKAAERQIGCHWFNNGKIRKFCKECPDGFVSGYVMKEV